RRCGKQFVPEKTHYQYCPRCYPDVAPMGGTTFRPRLGAAARRHGGVSRTSDNRRPVTLHGDVTSREIVRGLRDFFTDLYKHPTQASTLLLRAGMDESEIACLREQRWLDGFVMRFCPRLWEWLGKVVGSKARDVVIDCYGLYSGETRSMPGIARDLGITADHAAALRGWALKKLRDPEKQAELEAMLVSTARSVLEARQKDGERKGRFQPEG
ncbi:MAG: hypothetical protein JXM73_20555, partial [Anaerolineae bacterium]|nr:hypothetical protein [Anaerolineae bacterium]